MSTAMRKLQATEPHVVEIVDQELPDSGPNQVTARMVLSGISHGTEMTAILGTAPFVERTLTPLRTFRDKTSDDPSFYPFYWLGYDAVGVVEEIGSEVTKFRLGDRIWYPSPHQTHFQFDADSPNAHKLPAGLPDDVAILTNLATIGMGAVLDAQIKLGDVVVVFGGGVVGQFAAQEAALSGARQVFVVDPIESRRKFAEAHCDCIGIDPFKQPMPDAIYDDNGGNPPDVVIECSGNIRGLASAVQAAGLAGRVVAAGMYAGGAEAFSFSEEFLHNRITLIASMTVWGCPSRWPERWDRSRIEREVLHLLERGKLNIEGFVTGRFPFERAQEAYEEIERNPEGHIKLAFTYD